MEIRKLVQEMQVIGWTCDVCGQDCQKDPEHGHGTEMATFGAAWGYWSSFDKDMTSWKCDLCEVCAEKVKKLRVKPLKKLRINEQTGWLVCRQSLTLSIAMILRKMRKVRRVSCFTTHSPRSIFSVFTTQLISESILIIGLAPRILK